VKPPNPGSRRRQRCRFRRKSARCRECPRAASAEKSIEAAQASVTALEEMLRYLRVSAEFDGVITG